MRACARRLRVDEIVSEARALRAEVWAWRARWDTIDAMGGRLTQLDLLTDVVLGLAAGDDARLAWPRHGITEDITAAASAIEVAVQVLAGQHDQVEPPETLEANLLSVIPGARMTIIEGTGHLSPLEVPGQVANQLEQFTASLDPARR